jgi:kynurenine formamidase
MRRIEYLSYPLEQNNPVYGKPDQPMTINPVKSIESGDSCNVYSFAMENHWGTHVDGPAHFFSNAPGIADYPAEFWLFSNPQVINIEVKAGQIISPVDLLEIVAETTDLLILKTGWYKYRKNSCYCLENPGISPELGTLLRKKRKNIRAIGFDFISLSSYVNRMIGRQAHQVFLNPDSEGNPILIIEDMCLGADLKGLKEVWVAPLRLSSADSSPCTVIGVFND